MTDQTWPHPILLLFLFFLFSSSLPRLPRSSRSSLPNQQPTSEQLIHSRFFTHRVNNFSGQIVKVATLSEMEMFFVNLIFFTLLWHGRVNICHDWPPMVPVSPVLLDIPMACGLLGWASLLWRHFTITFSEHHHLLWLCHLAFPAHRVFASKRYVESPNLILSYSFSTRYFNKYYHNQSTASA